MKKTLYVLCIFIGICIIALFTLLEIGADSDKYYYNFNSSSEYYGVLSIIVMIYTTGFITSFLACLFYLIIDDKSGFLNFFFRAISITFFVIAIGLSWMMKYLPISTDCFPTIGIITRILAVIVIVGRVAFELIAALLTVKPKERKNVAAKVFIISTLFFVGSIFIWPIVSYLIKHYF